MADVARLGRGVRWCWRCRSLIAQPASSSGDAAVGYGAMLSVICWRRWAYLFGLLHDLTAGWRLPLIALLCLTVLHRVRRAGRPPPRDQLTRLRDGGRGGSRVGILP
ncbi:hypothetical protein M8494_00390 [Serratia ureilytica]